MDVKEYFLLTPETASDELKGYEVTIGIRSESATQYGVIEKVTDSKLHIRIGASVKKMDYDPENIILKVYQFEKGVRFVSKSEFEYDAAMREMKEARQQSGAKKAEKLKGAKKKPKADKKAKQKTAIEWS